MSAPSLLEIIHDEYEAIEIITGFSAMNSAASAHWGMSAEDGENATWFENQWEAMLVHNDSFQSGKGWFGIQDDVESKLYGLRSFEHRGAPATLDEARERGIYTVVNSMRSDLGSPLYGDVSAVLSSSFVRPLLLLSAIDTGEWTALCNQTTGGRRTDGILDKATASDQTFSPHSFSKDEPRRWPPAQYQSNCSAYNFSLGTLQHFDHLFLASLNYWERDVPKALASRVAVLLDPQGPKVRVPAKDYFQYWEGMPAGRLVFPQAVKFLIGSFPALFGTPAGTQLRQWCHKRGWALLWALGLNLGPDVEFWSIGYYNRSFPLRRRLLDPSVLDALASNVTISVGARAEFESHWDLVGTLRTSLSRSNVTMSPATTAQLWHMVANAAPGAFHLASLQARSCGDMDLCFGVSADGNCVCYAA